MVYISNEDFKRFEHIYKINLINCCSGYKSANLIGSKSKVGIENVAVFSSVTHIGSDPALLGFFADLQALQETPMTISKKQVFIRLIIFMKVI